MKHLKGTLAGHNIRVMFWIQFLEPLVFGTSFDPFLYRKRVIIFGNSYRSNVLERSSTTR